LRLTRGGETARSKFSFVVLVPDRARVEVFDALGRAAMEFVVRGNEAFLVLRSEKAYWRGGRDEVVEKFLGFPLSPEEIAGLLTGRWAGPEVQDWTLDRDGQGRVSAGSRGDVSFRVAEFFPDGVPRRLSFRGAGGEGTISLLEIAFDRPNGGPALDFLRTCASRTWAEMERLIR
jgi:hypothetical protein